MQPATPTKKLFRVNANGSMVILRAADKSEAKAMALKSMEFSCEIATPEDVAEFCQRGGRIFDASDDQAVVMVGVPFQPLTPHKTDAAAGLQTGAAQ